MLIPSAHCCNAVLLALVSCTITSYYLFDAFPESILGFKNPLVEFLCTRSLAPSKIEESTHVKLNWQKAENSFGALGTAVQIPQELQEKAVDTYNIHQFNLVASDLISLNRELPDYRSKRCQRVEYPEDLPDVSIIIVFHNEAWSTLIRTIHSVINRSPQKLLREIILVDDFSEQDYLKKPLEDYVRLLPIDIRIVRSTERQGLIKGRLKGTAIAKGEVLFFLDSHCECTDGWLEPLLYEIYKSRTTVTWPMIQNTSPDTFEVVGTNPRLNGGFDWRLQFLWDEEEEASDVAPVRSPALSGGIFAINREYFIELGEYDKDMDIWGFENVEISLRIWMCGGQILQIPCSYVAHVYRYKSAYTWPGGILKVISHNSQRVLNVWVDEYANLTYLFCPDIKGQAYGDITERQNLRTKLKCKNFQWYIDNVYPRLKPMAKLNGTVRGEVKNMKMNKCLDMPAKLIRYGYQRVRVSTCIPPETSFNARFVYTSDKQLINFLNLCVNWIRSRVMYTRCEDGNAKWDYNTKTLEFRFVEKPSYCLDVRSDEVEYPTVALCDGSEYQQWIIDEPK